MKDESSRARPLRIAIVGGGIGGLAAAIALRRAGFGTVEVHERARELREVGAALTLWSNALWALARLGLDEEVRAAGAVVRVGRLREPSGGVLVETPVEDVGRELGAPSVCLHRADLQTILVRAAREAGVVLRLGAECVGLAGELERAPRLRFADGSELEADVVIGADGLRSLVRAALVGEQAPRYAGYTCWRAIALLRHPGLPPGEAFETWGPGARFGAIGIDLERVYWFASANAPRDGRDGSDVRGELLARFGAWHAPIADVIEATPTGAIQRLDIQDRKPVRREMRGTGRVTLLGDAAHPTTPNLGQGACLALEDALVLAERLAAEHDPTRALREYETRRRARAAAVVRRSFDLGRVGQLSSPLLCHVRNAIMSRLPARMLRRSFADVLARGIDP